MLGMAIFLSFIDSNGKKVAIRVLTVTIVASQILGVWENIAICSPLFRSKKIRIPKVIRHINPKIAGPVKIVFAAPIGPKISINVSAVSMANPLKKVAPAVKSKGKAIPLKMRGSLDSCRADMQDKTVGNMKRIRSSHCNILNA